jgi:P-type Mg2+ transporter
LAPTYAAVPHDVWLSQRVYQQFGAIAHRLTLRPPETEFDRGIRRFGYFLTTAMLIMVLLVFAAHTLQGRPPMETLLFSIALAVGLSPELLPAILSVNLARGARTMAGCGVIVRRLNAIENLGSMDTLCTDKTGTLTEGVIQVEGAYDADGADSRQVLELAACNAAFQTGLSNPLDEAILQAHQTDLAQTEKLGEIPFDFVRKRVSVLVCTTEGVRLIMKGAFHHVLEVCTRCLGGVRLDAAKSEQLEKLSVDQSRPGTVLLWTTALLIGLTFAVPYIPFVAILGFVPLPGAVLVTLSVITLLYMVATEVGKKWFYRSIFLEAGT